MISVHGIPKRILSDRGSEFVNRGVKSLCSNWGVEKIETSPHNSKGNGHVERYHRWVNSSMTALQVKFGPNWDEYVDACCFAYRVSVNESTGFSPFLL